MHLWSTLKAAAAAETAAVRIHSPFVVVAAAVEVVDGSTQVEAEALVCTQEQQVWALVVAYRSVAEEGRPHAMDTAAAAVAAGSRLLEQQELQGKCLGRLPG